MPIALVFRNQPLPEISDLDADTLAEELQATPSVVPGRQLASKIHTAVRTAVGETREIEIDSEQLNAVHQACADSLAMQRVPGLTQLCAAVAQIIGL